MLCEPKRFRAKKKHTTPRTQATDTLDHALLRDAPTVEEVRADILEELKADVASGLDLLELFSQPKVLDEHSGIVVKCLPGLVDVFPDLCVVRALS